MRADDPHAGQLDVPTVFGRAERAGSEPARQPGAVALELRKPHLRSLAFTGARVNPVAQHDRQVRQSDEYASFEFSDHHGAVSFLLSFHALRKL
jgi:hypothetical protein